MIDEKLFPIFFPTLCLDSEPSKLSACLQDVSESDWEALTQLAGQMGVSGILYDRIKRGNLDDLVPPGLLATLRQEYLGTSARNLVNKLELIKIAKAFQAHDIPLIVLKGAFLAEFVYPNPAMRRMSDIDLMVQLDDLSRAAQVLSSLGYQAESVYFIENIPATAHHLPGFVKKGGPHIEVHWTIMSKEEYRPKEINLIWQRAIPVCLSDSQLLSLSPEDLLLHICGHATYQHTFEMGLRAVYDVLVIAEHYQKEMDWPRFIQHTREWRWERGIYLFLRLAKGLLGAPIPEELLLNLMPANFDETMLAIAQAQLLGSEGMAGRITFPLANWHAASFPGKIAIFCRRLFLPKPYLAARFGISPASPIIYFYYPVRFFDLLIRYGKTTYHLWRGTAASVSFVERKAQLQDWLNKD